MPGGALDVIARRRARRASARSSRCTATRSWRSGRSGCAPAPITAACRPGRACTLTGPGGHTARPQLTVDLVYALGRVVTDVPALLSRLVDPRPAMSLVWGAVNAGTRANAIPQRGPLPGHRAGARPGRLAASAEDWSRAGRASRRAATGAEVDVDYRAGVPPVVNDAGRRRRSLRGGRAAALGADAGRRRRRAWAARTSPGTSRTCPARWPGSASARPAADRCDLHRRHLRRRRAGDRGRRPHPGRDGHPGPRPLWRRPVRRRPSARRATGQGRRREVTP